jgi:hypothetical protein
MVSFGDVWLIHRESTYGICNLYRVAVTGPVGEHTGCGGFPVNEHPLPVEMYVAPGRYGW